MEKKISVKPIKRKKTVVKEKEERKFDEIEILSLENNEGSPEVGDDQLTREEKSLKQIAILRKHFSESGTVSRDYFRPIAEAELKRLNYDSKTLFQLPKKKGAILTKTRDFLLRMVRFFIPIKQKHSTKNVDWQACFNTKESFFSDGTKIADECKEEDQGQKIDKVLAELKRLNETVKNTSHIKYRD